MGYKQAHTFCLLDIFQMILPDLIGSEQSDQSEVAQLGTSCTQLCLTQLAVLAVTAQVVFHTIHVSLSCDSQYPPLSSW